MFMLIILCVVIIYICLFLFAFFYSDKMIFVPERLNYKDPADIIKLKTANNETIVASYLNNPQAKYTILFSHGNTHDLGSAMGMAKDLYNMGFSVFLYDYLGYGLSSGKPSEQNSYLSINAAYDYLTQNLKIKPSNIILYGHSLGAAVSLDLAVRQPAAALILQGPFISAFRVKTRITLIPFDKFNSLAKVVKLKMPLMVIHGTNDKTIPFWHGKKLYDTANTDKYFYVISGAGHSPDLDTAEYKQEIQKFLKLIRKQRSSKRTSM